MSEREEASLDDALMRRISEALDRGGIDADPELRARIEGDPDALRYAQELVRIDEALASFGREAPEPDWDALAARIDRHLDDELEPLEEVDAPPRFFDEGEISRTIAVESRGGAPVIDLASRRKELFVWSGAFAAAAALVAVAVGGVSFSAGELEGGASWSEAPSAIFEAEEEVEAAAEAPPAPPEAAEAARYGEAARAVGTPSDAERLAGTWARAAQQRRRSSRTPHGEAPAAAAPQPAPRGEAPAAAAPEPALRVRARAGGGGAPRVDRPSALARIEPRLQRCLAPVGAPARVTIDVEASGAVRDVRVGPPYEGADAACIEEVIRSARLEPRAESYRVVHRFRPARGPSSGSTRDRRSPATRSGAAPATAPLGGLDGLD